VLLKGVRLDNSSKWHFEYCAHWLAGSGLCCSEPRKAGVVR